MPHWHSAFPPTDIEYLVDLESEYLSLDAAESYRQFCGRIDIVSAHATQDARDLGWRLCYLYFDALVASQLAPTASTRHWRTFISVLSRFLLEVNGIAHDRSELRDALRHLISIVSENADLLLPEIPNGGIAS